MAHNEDSESRKGQPDKIAIAYVSPAFLRSFHVDGAFGGATPNGHIHATFYAERSPHPKAGVLTPAPEGGVLSESIETYEVERPALVRELQVGVFMEYPVAKLFHEWLGRHLKILAAAIGVEGEEEEGGDK
jgi:hypothetical protein